MKTDRSWRRVQTESGMTYLDINEIVAVVKKENDGVFGCVPAGTQVDGTTVAVCGDICNPQRPDLLAHPMSDLFSDIQWNYLANFSPIDLRHESFKDDGSLLDQSPAKYEIIQRVEGRFFRS